MLRSLLLVLIVLWPLLAQGNQLPPPWARSAECGLLLPCIPPRTYGLAANLRLALLLEAPLVPGG